MKNKYEIRGDEVIIFLKHNDKILETRISLNKLERAMEYKNTWYVTYSKCTNSYYVNGCLQSNKNKKTVLLHRWISNISDELQIDHFNNDTLNNTDSNLRVATHGENRQNLNGVYRNNTSGVRGVSWNIRKQKWIAYIRVNGIRTHLGYFDLISDAEKAVKLARAEMMPFSKEAAMFG